ncbi:hypothetical protein ATK86_0370 [Nocardia fluminea]|uniref:Uncharacterized protein n=2 Tax=Nocardia fluminea TaxID=134984 RepID=A0A2N3WWW8_9NOCA|nr:hypothetical protein ATK86_0370 [Nocardia fluminea]
MLSKGDSCELLAVAVSWLTDDPQPGIVLVELLDAYGRPHQLVGKSVYFGGELLPTSPYPCPTSIRCTIEDINDDLATVSTTDLLTDGPAHLPFVFEVLLDLLVPPNPQPPNASTSLAATVRLAE